ncbi:MAG: hypothetical protein PHT07_14890 [Paludibacter sp.]|nr:hypothetical protein [Paludibacter sp.]
MITADVFLDTKENFYGEKSKSINFHYDSSEDEITIRIEGKDIFKIDASDFLREIAIIEKAQSVNNQNKRQIS